MLTTASPNVRSFLQDRTTLSNPSTSRVRPAPRASQHGQSSSLSLYPHLSPIVYPAFLSRVAEALHARIVRSDTFTDELTYGTPLMGFRL
jgi:hypothetical protein